MSEEHLIPCQRFPARTNTVLTSSLLQIIPNTTRLHITRHTYSCLPVDYKRQRPFDNVVERESLEATEGHLGGVGVDDSFFLLGLYGQDTQKLCNDIMGHQVNLENNRNNMNVVTSHYFVQVQKWPINLTVCEFHTPFPWCIKALPSCGCLIVNAIVRNIKLLKLGLGRALGSDK